MWMYQHMKCYKHKTADPFYCARHTYTLHAERERPTRIYKFNCYTWRICFFYTAMPNVSTCERFMGERERLYCQRTTFDEKISKICRSSKCNTIILGGKKLWKAEITFSQSKFRMSANMRCCWKRRRLLAGSISFDWAHSEKFNQIEMKCNFIGFNLIIYVWQWD